MSTASRLKVEQWIRFYLTVTLDSIRFHASHWTIYWTPPISVKIAHLFRKQKWKKLIHDIFSFLLIRVLQREIKLKKRQYSATATRRTTIETILQFFFLATKAKEWTWLNFDEIDNLKFNVARRAKWTSWMRKVVVAATKRDSVENIDFIILRYALRCYALCCHSEILL